MRKVKGDNEKVIKSALVVTNVAVGRGNEMGETVTAATQAASVISRIALPHHLFNSTLFIHRLLQSRSSLDALQNGRA